MAKYKLNWNFSVRCLICSDALEIVSSVEHFTLQKFTSRHINDCWINGTPQLFLIPYFDIIETRWVKNKFFRLSATPAVKVAKVKKKLKQTFGEEVYVAVRSPL